jgi:radical SAM superfamily enzyme YgiQ (UPF0313 family)
VWRNILSRKVEKNLIITFVELPALSNGQLSGDLSTDFYSLYRLPARCVDHLAAIAQTSGFSDTVAMTPVVNRSGRLLRSADWDRFCKSDVIGISVITRTASPSYQLADFIRSVNPRVKIIFGGPHVSAFPKEALQHGDIVVMQEGDYTLIELLYRLNEYVERPFLSDIKGIAYKQEKEVVVNPPREFLTNEGLNALPFPNLPQNVLDYITHQTIITSRGCPHNCEYCSIIQNFGSRYRCLSIDRSIELIRHHLKRTNAPVFFADDNFTANPDRAKAILSRCLSEGLEFPRWVCQSRIEAAFDDDLLDLMKKTKMETVIIGFESISNEALRQWRKGSTLEKNREAIERFHAKGIFFHGTFVLGSDVDTPETIRETVAFAKEMKLGTAQFLALTPLPGTPLAARLEAEGRVLTHDWHLYDGQHAIIQPKHMTPVELQEGIIQAFKDFYSDTEDSILGRFIRAFGRRQVRNLTEETRPHLETLKRLEP